MISIDTETNGVDFHHGARPYFVTICTDNGNQEWWEWDVNPLTRKVSAPKCDLLEIKERVDSNELVLQNARFDAKALKFIGAVADWPWGSTHELLFMAHLLGSNQPKDLASLSSMWIGRDIQPYEDRMREAVQSGRRLVQQAKLKAKRATEKPDVILSDWERLLSSFAIAKFGRSDMPSVKKSSGKDKDGKPKDPFWKMDGWLPRAMRKLGHGPKEWDTVTAEYANADSAATMLLFPAMMEEVKRRGLWKLYLERLKLLPIIFSMEMKGVTLSGKRLVELRSDCQAESGRAAKVMHGVAGRRSYDLVLPAGSRNKSLDDFCFEVLKLTSVRIPKAHSFTSAMDSKNAIPHWLSVLLEECDSRKFVEALERKRAYDAAASYLNGYERFWLPLGQINPWPRQMNLELAEVYGEESKNWFVLHPNINPTGTDTLRCSSNNPNGQNVSGQGEANLRSAFGPAPGREWWRFDAKNLELRIPAYESGEEEMIALFKQPNDPPYYGSYHLLISHILRKELFESTCRVNGGFDGRLFKKKFESAEYRWIKEGNFAIACGAIEESGTADAAYRVPGAQAQIKEHMKAMAALSARLLKFAERNGYVETIPDRTVDPKHGYPLLCARTNWGKVLPTTPFSYHVQGTAMWWMLRCMVEVHAKLEAWREEDDFDGFINLQIHDELDLDFPKAADPQADPDHSNLWRVREIQRIMSNCGDDIGIPILVSAEFHPDNWAEGVSL